MNTNLYVKFLLSTWMKRKLNHFCKYENTNQIEFLGHRSVQLNSVLLCSVKNLLMFDFY